MIEHDEIEQIGYDKSSHGGPQMLRLVRNLYRRLFRVPAPQIGDFTPSHYFDFTKAQYFENGVEKPWPEMQFPKATFNGRGLRVLGTIPKALSDDELRRLTE